MTSSSARRACSRSAAARVISRPRTLVATDGTRAAPLYGLVLAGGSSTRMRRDKAALSYHGKPQLEWTWELVAGITDQTFVSARAEQASEPLRAAHPLIIDRLTGKGPIAGIAAAQDTHPEVAWLVVACDLPFLSRATLAHLLAHRDSQKLATAYRSTYDGLPEPLCS